MNRIRHVTIDCHDPHRLARFWSDAIGFVEDPTDPNDPDDDEVLLVDPTGHHPGLLFIEVPEPKTVKNRIHLDVEAGPAGRDATAERFVALGATVVDDRRVADGSGWIVLGDPEGNELCVERSAAEGGAPGPVDTGERDLPPIHDADEATMLTGMLDWYREGVLRKVDGVLPHHAAARPLRSGTSMAGVVKHLALVEDGWFTEEFAGRPRPEPWASVDWDADPDWEWRTAPEDPLADVVALYRAACDRSRAVVEATGRSLDEVGAVTTHHRFTLRFAVLHLIEETARHLGHLDVLREHLDGTTGE